MAPRAWRQDGDLRDHRLRRRSEGLTHRPAVAATAIQFCHVVWRILTDRPLHAHTPRSTPRPRTDHELST